MQKIIKGNKGEWSELFVLVSLIAEGKMHQADINLNIDPNNTYDVISAYKNESNYILEFSRSNVITILKIEKSNRSTIATFTQTEFRNVSKKLYNGIKLGKGNSFEISELYTFLNKSLITKLKADASLKADLKLKIYDHRIARETDLGFSVKSLLGGNSTLYNTGPGNNFIYTSKSNINESVSEFNKRTYKSPINKESKITYRLKELAKAGVNFKFKAVQSDQFSQNLKMVDGDMAEILAWGLFYRWKDNYPTFKQVADCLESNDPMNYYKGKPSVQRIYEYKIKRFLTEAAMGMTSEKVWLGEYDSFGGVIIAKEDGGIVCFHIYDFNLFREYLLNNTTLEQASTGEDENNPGNPKATGKKYHYSWLYQENEEIAIKLNLQVRFM